MRNEDVDGYSAAGAVNVMYGTDSGLATLNNEFYTQGDPLENSPAANDFFGAALAIGDLDGDGYGDLAVGVPREDFVGAGRRRRDQCHLWHIDEAYDAQQRILVRE